MGSETGVVVFIGILWVVFWVVIVVKNSKNKTSLSKEMQKEMGPLPLREDVFYLYDYYFEVRGANFETVESELDKIVKYLELYNAYKGHVEPGELKWYVMEHGGSSTGVHDDYIINYPDIERCTLRLEGRENGEIYKWHLSFPAGYSDVMNLILTKIEMIFGECDPEFIREKKLENPKSIKRMERIEKKQEERKKKADEAVEEFMRKQRKLREKEEAKKERKEARQKKKNGSIY